MRYWLTFSAEPGSVAAKLRQMTVEVVKSDRSFAFDWTSISRCHVRSDEMHIVNVACECTRRSYLILQEIELADLYFATSKLLRSRIKANL